MKYQVYKIRWLLLAIECTAISTRLFVAKSFALVNNVVKSYFGVTPYAVDVLGTVDTITAIPSGLLLVVLGGGLGLRSLMLLKSSLMFLSMLFCTIGFFSPELYWIVLLGRILTPEVLVYVVPTLLAANWFPENELATTFSIPPVIGALISATSGIVFPFLLSGRMVSWPVVETDLSQIENTNTSMNRTHLVFGEQDTRIKSVSIIGTATFLMLIALILTIIYSKDHPPTPPSASQTNILKNSEASHRPRIDIWLFIHETKELLRIPQFILILSATFLRGSARYSSVLTPSFILQTFPAMDNRTSGLLIIVGSFFAVPGYFTAARVIDKYKNPKLITVTGYTLAILSVVAVYFGHLYKSLITLFIAYPLEWFFECVVFAASSEFFLETTYPRNKMILTLYYYSSYFLGIFTYVSFDRWLQQQTDETWAVFAFIPTNIFALVLYLIAKPEYKRTRLDRMEQNYGDQENQKLIDNTKSNDNHG